MAGFPYAVFTALDDIFYEQYFGEERTEDSPPTREHYNYELEYWENAAKAAGIVWGPLTLLTFLNMSEVFG